MRNLVALLDERTILVIENQRRYRAEDVRPHLLWDWRCGQEPFGLLITHIARSPV